MILSNFLEFQFLPLLEKEQMCLAVPFLFYWFFYLKPFHFALRNPQHFFSNILYISHLFSKHFPSFPFQTHLSSSSTSNVLHGRGQNRSFQCIYGWFLAIIPPPLSELPGLNIILSCQAFVIVICRLPVIPPHCLKTSTAGSLSLSSTQLIS